jgi:hypothetical protein
MHFGGDLPHPAFRNQFDLTLPASRCSKIPNTVSQWASHRRVSVFAYPAFACNIGISGSEDTAGSMVRMPTHHSGRLVMLSSECWGSSWYSKMPLTDDAMEVLKVLNVLTPQERRKPLRVTRLAASTSRCSGPNNNVTPPSLRLVCEQLLNNDTYVSTTLRQIPAKTSARCLAPKVLNTPLRK